MPPKVSSRTRGNADPRAASSRRGNSWRGAVRTASTRSSGTGARSPSASSQDERSPKPLLSPFSEAQSRRVENLRNPFILRWIPEAWSMARQSPEKTTMRSRTVIVTDPFDRGHAPRGRAPLREGSRPGIPGEGRVLEKDRRFMGVSSFDVEFEPDADEMGSGVEAPNRQDRVLEERLGRARIDPPPKDAGAGVQDIGHALDEREERGAPRIVPRDRRVDDDRAGLDQDDRPDLSRGAFPQGELLSRGDIGRREKRQPRVSRAGVCRQRQLLLERRRPELVRGRCRGFEEPELDLGREAAAGVKKVDPHPVERRESRLARFLPFLETQEGILGPAGKLEPRRDDKEGQGQTDQALDEGEAAFLHGENPRSRETKSTATVSGPGHPDCRALRTIRFMPSPSSAISHVSVIRQRPGSIRTVSVYSPAASAGSSNGRDLRDSNRSPTAWVSAAMTSPRRFARSARVIISAAPTTRRRASAMATRTSTKLIPRRRRPRFMARSARPSRSVRRASGLENSSSTGQAPCPAAASTPGANYLKNMGVGVNGRRRPEPS